MSRKEWLMKFRLYQTMDTLEKVFENLIYARDPAEHFAMTQAYDHRKAEIIAGRFFDRIPKHMWRHVK